MQVSSPFLSVVLPTTSNFTANSRWRIRDRVASHHRNHDSGNTQTPRKADVLFDYAKPASPQRCFPLLSLCRGRRTTTDQRHAHAFGCALRLSSTEARSFVFHF